MCVRVREPQWTSHKGARMPYAHPKQDEVEAGKQPIPSSMGPPGSPLSSLCSLYISTVCNGVLFCFREAPTWLTYTSEFASPLGNARSSNLSGVLHIKSQPCGMYVAKTLPLERVEILYHQTCQRAGNDCSSGFCCA